MSTQQHPAHIKESHNHDDDCAPGDLDHHLAIAKSICDAAGERFTPLRSHIFELIVNTQEPVKAYDLLDRLHPDYGSPRPPTIYRALEFLSKLGLIHRVEALNAYVVCDHVHENARAEFYICDSCNKVIERHISDHSVTPPAGFTVKRSIVEHYGICPDCAAA
ncbi:transcriptional repressor [Robiginitomaculum antarcticum]|uniref:transcriptional repressor n=1 Tax=Robiginitomaculum antarcticum TaxID=437507 RepID=UPI00036CDCBC|nr:transcriptional repressor [Robiginitomaculum antarcticum]